MSILIIVMFIIIAYGACNEPPCQNESDMTEIEVKILEVDRVAVEKRLVALGAVKVFDDEIHAIYYDLPDSGLKTSGRTLRLRKEGSKTVLAFKSHRENTAAKEREEHEVEISSFEDMKTILDGLGYIPWLEMRKHRTSYKLRGTHLEFDRYCGHYAYIPEFLEIEGNNLESIYSVAETLGFSKQDCSPWDATDLIGHYTGLDTVR